MNKIIGHLKTVHTHRKAVRQMCFKCGLYWQGLVHDLSKYSPIEFIPSVKYWTGKRSPIDTEIEDKGYSMCWLHHKGHNKHHFEYWIDYAHREDPVPMPDKYLVEMFCDRVGACKTYLGNNMTNDAPLNYFKTHMTEREKKTIHPKTYAELKFLLEDYAKHGEDFTCEMIKKYILRS